MIFDLSHLPITTIYVLAGIFIAVKLRKDWSVNGKHSVTFTKRYDFYGKNIFTFSESCYKKDDDLENIVIENDEQV